MIGDYDITLSVGGVFITSLVINVIILLLYHRSISYYVIIGCCYIKPKLHLYDLLCICCTTSCTTNPQQIEAYTANQQQVHNKSN